MAVLDKENLITDLTTAFTTDSWTATATQFTTAIDSYIKTANVIEIPIAGAWTLTPFTAGLALGICTATTTTSATLYAACVAAFALPLWGSVSSLIGTAIGTVLATSTVILTSYAIIAPPYTFGGVGAATASITVDPADVTDLTTKINTAFTTGTVWTTVASDIATAVDDFIKTAAVTILPSPSGNLPQGWTGTGGDIGGFK